MAEFHETMYGKRFFENQLPELIKAINKLATAIAEQNTLNIFNEAKEKFPETLNKLG